MTGESFLADIFPSIGGNIRFAYLDNYDWDWGIAEGDYRSEYAAISDEYRLRGVEINNAESQAVHLAQSILINSFTADGCGVLFDDTWALPDGAYSGKGGSAVPWLLANGWSLVERRPSSVHDMRGYVFLRKGRYRRRIVRPLLRAARYDVRYLRSRGVRRTFRAAFAHRRRRRVADSFTIRD